MIEQIWIGKTSGTLRACSSVGRFGPDPLITIPARGFWNAAQRGLTEDRTRSHANRVRKLLRDGRQPQKCPTGFSNRLGQGLILFCFYPACRALGFSPRSPHGRRMFAFRVGWIEVVCAVDRAAAVGAISPSPCVPAGRIPSSLEDQRRSRIGSYAIAASRKGVPERHMACSVTASFRARATFALRGPVLSAIALAQLRRREPPRFRQ